MLKKLRNLLYRNEHNKECAVVLVRAKNTIANVLDPLIPQNANCALVDFPNYPNVGDSAIWLGEREYLRGRNVEVSYACDHQTYSRAYMEARITSDTIILFQGGGNLGDLWPWHQKLREKVIQDFPNNKVILFPQSIHFNEEAALKQARSVFQAHADLTVLVREFQSLERAKQNFSVNIQHCPDMAFLASAPEAKSKPKYAVSCVFRTDAEAVDLSIPAVPPNVIADDWVIEENLLVDQDGARDQLVIDNTVEDASASQSASSLMLEPPSAMLEPPSAMLEPSSAMLEPSSAMLELYPVLYKHRLEAYDRLAKMRLQRGYKILGQGKVTVTDRLHGHILSLLMGSHHVVLDNNYGKVRAVYDAWTKDCGLGRWSKTRQEAITLALKIAADL